jgi:prophage regulatory protein
MTAMNDATFHTAVPCTDDIMRLPEVLKVIGLSRASIYRLMKLEEFPQQVPLGLCSVGWARSEVAEWIEARKASRPARQRPQQLAA